MNSEISGTSTNNSTNELKDNYLVTGAIAPSLIRFAIPFLIASFLQSVYGAVDLFVVGRFADSAAVSAVSIGSQLMMIATVIVQGISMGGTVRIGFKIGRKDAFGTGISVGNTCFLFVLLALFLTPLMLIFRDTLVIVMQTPAEAVVDCETYMFICSCGLPFIIGYNAVSGIFRGIGDSKTPVYFITIACIVNIVLDFLLTGCLGMGTAGAALATISAQGMSFFFALIFMLIRGFDFPVRRSCFIPVQEELSAILRVGLPLALQDALVHVSFLAISAIINTLGLVASAAVGVSEKLMGFAFLIPGAFSSAVATMVAQNLGAGSPKRALSSAKWGVGISVMCGVVVCILCWTIPDMLIGIFSKDAAVIEKGAEYIRTYSLDCILTGLVFNINAYLNGNSKSLVCFIHSTIATFLVRIPVTWIMSLYTDGSLLPMGLAAPCASLVSILICLVYFKIFSGIFVDQTG